MSLNSVNITPFLNGLKTVSKDTAKLKAFLEEQTNIFESTWVSESDWAAICREFNYDDYATRFDCEIADGITVRYDDTCYEDNDTAEQGIVSIVLNKDKLCQLYPNILEAIKQLDFVKSAAWISDIDEFLENATYEIFPDCINIMGKEGGLQIKKEFLNLDDSQGVQEEVESEEEGTLDWLQVQELAEEYNIDLEKILPALEAKYGESLSDLRFTVDEGVVGVIGENTIDYYCYSLDTTAPKASEEAGCDSLYKSISEEMSYSELIERGGSYGIDVEELISSLQKRYGVEIESARFQVIEGNNIKVIINGFGMLYSYTPAKTNVPPEHTENTAPKKEQKAPTVTAVDPNRDSIYHKAGCAVVEENEVVTVEETTVERPIPEESWRYGKDNEDLFPFIETARELNTAFAQYTNKNINLNFNFSSLQLEEAKAMLGELTTLLESANAVREEAKKAYFQEMQINNLIDINTLKSKIQELNEFIARLEARQEHYNSITKEAVPQKTKAEIEKTLKKSGVSNYKIEQQDDGTLKVVINNDENSYIIFNGAQGDAIEFQGIGKIILRDVVYRNNPQGFREFYETLEEDQKRYGKFESDENGAVQCIGTYEIQKTQSSDEKPESSGDASCEDIVLKSGLGISASTVQALKDSGYIDLSSLSDEEKEKIEIEDTGSTERKITYNDVTFVLEYENGQFKKVNKVITLYDYDVKAYVKLASILNTTLFELLKQRKVQKQGCGDFYTYDNGNDSPISLRYDSKTDDYYVSDAYMTLDEMDTILSQTLNSKDNLEKFKTTLKNQLEKFNIDYTSAKLHFEYLNTGIIVITYTGENGNELEFVYNIDNMQFSEAPIK